MLKQINRTQEHQQRRIRPVKMTIKLRGHEFCLKTHLIHDSCVTANNDNRERTTTNNFSIKMCALSMLIPFRIEMANRSPLIIHRTPWKRWLLWNRFSHSRKKKTHKSSYKFQRILMAKTNILNYWFSVRTKFTLQIYWLNKFGFGDGTFELIKATASNELCRVCY